MDIVTISNQGMQQSRLRQMVLDSLTSEHSKAAYSKAIDDLFVFAAGRPLTRELLTSWKASMSALSAATVNLRLSAIRKMVIEAKHNGMIDQDSAASLIDVSNVKQQGARLGNWLTKEQTKMLLAVPNQRTLKGIRDYCILALLVGCALRRSELSNLNLETVQMRDGRWVLADLCGKGNRLRTVAVPTWVKASIDAWTHATGITSGRVFRAVSKSGYVNSASLSDWSVWEIVQESAESIGINNFAAHDLRRTCAKLCRTNGGDIQQIQFMLGHSSVQTTERYLGTVQNLTVAVNDNLFN
jgi:integrase